MTLESRTISDDQISTSVKWLSSIVWTAGYPETAESDHTVGAVCVRQISASPSTTTPADVGATMKSVSRQMLSAVSAHALAESFEVRIVADPTNAGTTRTAFYLVAKSRGTGPNASGVVKSVLISAAMCLPVGFVVETVDDPTDVLRPTAGHEIIEVQRVEHLTLPQWDYIPSEYFYHLDPVSGDGSGWPSLWRTLARVPSRVIISYLFKPTELTLAERDIVGSIITDLDLFSHDRVQPNILGYDDFYPGDKNAEISAAAWRDRLRSLGPTPLIGRVFVSAPRPLAEAVAAQLVSSIGLRNDGAGDSLCLIDHHHLSPSEKSHVNRTMTDLEVWPVDTLGLWRVDHPPLSLRRFQYMYGPDEGAAICVLPVPDEQGVPGFVLARQDRQRRATQYESRPEGPAVELGDVMNLGAPDGRADLPLAAINRHSLVVGVQGYGKTTAVMTILADLWRKHRVPWLVIEPTRPEYRGMLGISGLDQLSVFALGRDDISPIRLNPMEPPPGVRCETHRSALLAIFRLGMPLVPPLPELLEQALERCYLMAGWDYDTCVQDGVPPPTLRDLSQAFGESFHEANYVGEAKNVSSAFGVRLKALLAGGSGRMLDTVRSSDFQGLMRRPCIFEMRDLEAVEEKALFAALLLHQVRSVATNAGSSAGQLRHVTVIEEAHRILPAEARGSEETGAATRALAAEEFVNAIAEMRSLGEGFILSTQRPSRLTRAAAGNTDTRLVFHLTDADDREAMLSDMAASENDRHIAPRLRIGECLGRWLPLEQPEVVRIRPAIGIDTARVPSDEVVAESMAGEAELTRRLRPYSLCSKSVCESGCVGSTRSAGRALELRTRASFRASPMANEPNLSFESYVGRLWAAFAKHHSDNPQVVYCAVVHNLLDRPQDGLLGLSIAEVDERRAALERAAEGRSHGGARQRHQRNV